MPITSAHDWRYSGLYFSVIVFQFWSARSHRDLMIGGGGCQMEKPSCDFCNLLYHYHTGFSGICHQPATIARISSPSSPTSRAAVIVLPIISGETATARR